MTRLAYYLVSALMFAPLVAAQTTIYVDCTNSSCGSADGSPGSPFCTIQEGLNAAVDGDTVLVHPCTYVETIDFLGKAVTLKGIGGEAVTIIDGNQNGSVVTFQSGEVATSVLDGFTVTNGKTSGLVSGGGISCLHSSPTIRNTTVSANSASYFGGGIYCLYSSAAIVNTTVSGNDAHAGGGIYCLAAPVTITAANVTSNTARRSSGGGISCAGFSSAAIITNTTVTGNTAYLHGGGILCYSASPVIANSVIHGNSAIEGGGLLCVGSSPRLANVSFTLNSSLVGGSIDALTGYFSGIPSYPILTNTIAWGDSGIEIFSDASSSVTVTYSNIQGGYPGAGNIDADPLFLDPLTGDLRLDCSSPCVDAGIRPPGIIALLPFDHSGADLRKIGAAIDMGADEVGTLWDFNAPASAPWVGQLASFTARATSGQNGNLSEAYLSLGDGSTSGGINVPLAGGRKLMLERGGAFGWWVSLPNAHRRVNLNGCGGISTVSLTLPTIPIGVTAYFSGITWDLGAGVVTSISETQSFVTQ